MKISLINGSQKNREANSGIILDKLKGIINEKHEVKIYKSGITAFDDETLKAITSGDIIVFAFPLFYDAIPSFTLKTLVDMEDAIKKAQAKHLAVYAIINNGFYEGRQTRFVFEMLQHWCKHCEIKFCGGIGQGSGEMFGKKRDVPEPKSPFKKFLRALKLMVEKMESKESFKTIYLNPGIPRFIHNIVINRIFDKLGAKNNLTRKDLLRRLEKPMETAAPQ
jgi:multimeric flavodoxin WrbA